jgi:hypothetical protein
MHLNEASTVNGFMAVSFNCQGLLERRAPGLLLNEKIQGIET